jgi:hypothetical protein
MQIRLNTDLASGLFGLALAGLFWSQRGNVGFMSSVFPDTVLMIIGLISAVLVARGFIAPTAQTFDLAGSGKLLSAIGILALWWLGIANVGFVSTSVPLFVVLAMMLIRANRALRWRDLAMAIGVAITLTYGFYWVFTEVLGIRPFRAPFI